MKHNRWETTPHYRGVMRDAARALRARQTASEAILWSALRRNQLGVHVRRQQQIGPFIVDFLIRSVNLVVEVDGSIHELQVDRDRERQKAIESLGYRFLRFTAANVENDLTSVISTIRASIASNK